MPAQVTRVGPDPHPFFFCKLYILKQMLETCASMTFPDFQRLMEWCQIFFAKMRLKAYIGGRGVPYHPLLPDMYQISDISLS